MPPSMPGSQIGRWHSQNSYSDLNSQAHESYLLVDFMGFPLGSMGIGARAGAGARAGQNEPTVRELRALYGSPCSAIIFPP